MPQNYASSLSDYLRVLANYTRELTHRAHKSPNLIMLHVGRSGSTVLGDLLGQHPDLHWDLEVLLHKRVKRYARMVPFRKKIISDPIRTIHWRMLLSEKKGYGFELMPFQLEPYGLGLPEFLQRLRPLDIRYAVVLERKNTLRLVISRLHAMRKGQWHVAESSDTEVKTASVHVNLDNVYGSGSTLLENLDYFAGLHNKIGPSLKDYKTLNLTYEDDIAPNPLIGYERCCQFLELPPWEGVSVRLKKMNPFSLNEMIDNFGDVEKNLAGTCYEWMLYD
jgi:hypothetical protein